MAADLIAFIRALEARYGLPSRLGPSELGVIAQELAQLCQGLSFDERRFPEAGPGEACVYALALSDCGGPSIYLVSDGPGVSSPPHEHQTWAIIFGLRGCERNTLFRRLTEASRSVRAVGEAVALGPGQTLVLAAADIHATDVVGLRATFHLHLYGAALSALPPFSDRCYAVDPGV